MASVSSPIPQEDLRGPWLSEKGVGRGMDSQKAGTGDSKLGHCSQDSAQARCFMEPCVARSVLPLCGLR